MQFNYIFLVILPELLLLVITAVYCFSYQLIIISKAFAQNKAYHVEYKSISYAKVANLIVSLILFNLFLFLILNISLFEHYLAPYLTAKQYYISVSTILLPAIYSFFSKAIPFANHIWIDKKIEYRITAHPLTSLEILDKYLESQVELINILKSDNKDRFNEIKIYIQKFKTNSDYFQLIELVRIATDTSKEFDNLLSELEKNIKKAEAFNQAEALKMILSARLPIEKFKDIFSDIHSEIINLTGDIKNKTNILKIYCECIEQAVVDHGYSKKDKIDLVSKFFLIFNDISFQHSEDLVEAVCNYFNNIFPTVREFLPTPGRGLFYQYGIEGMERMERMLSSDDKKKYSDTMRCLIKEIKDSQKGSR